MVDRAINWLRFSGRLGCPSGELVVCDPLNFLDAQVVQAVLPAPRQIYCRIGYQYLLGSVVGKVILSDQDTNLWDVNPLNWELVAEVDHPSGMIGLGDLRWADKQPPDELADQCKAACSTNEQAGLLAGSRMFSCRTGKEQQKSTVARLNMGELFGLLFDFFPY